MGLPSYATVEQVAEAADIKATAYATDRLHRLTLAASRRIDLKLRRHFYPLTEARTYDIDSRDRTRVGALGSGIFLEADLLSMSALTEDGSATTVPGPELYSFNGAAPYSWLETSASLAVVTGVWGYSQDTEPAGTLAASVSDTTGTSVSASDSAAVGIGDAIQADSEWMIVTAKAQVDTGQNLGGNLTAVASDDTVNLSDGTEFSVGEDILINSEKMLILEISGNNGTVSRAYDGTTLAAHTSGDDIYAPRTLTVERGALGSTAATHSNGAALVRNLPPAPITEWALAEALNGFAQESSAYGRTIGSGDNEREARGAGLASARKEAMLYRRARLAAV